MVKDCKLGIGVIGVAGRKNLDKGLGCVVRNMSGGPEVWNWIRGKSEFDAEK